MGKGGFIEKGGQESGRSSEEQGEHPFCLQPSGVRMREKHLSLFTAASPTPTKGLHKWEGLNKYLLSD